jgi:hypothetical protein
MKLKLEFEYDISPLKVSIDSDWEPITAVCDLDVLAMFPDTDVANKAKEELSSLPMDSWIVCPYFNPNQGFTRPVTQLPSIELPDRMRMDINHLDEIFQKTFCEDYPPDSGFASTAEEDTFWEAGNNLAVEISKHLPAEWQFEFRTPDHS